MKENVQIAVKSSKVNEVHDCQDITKKCGYVVFIKEIEKFAINCNFCYSSCKDLINFTNHFLTQHLYELNNLNIQIKLENDLFSVENNCSDATTDEVNFEAVQCPKTIFEEPNLTKENNQHKQKISLNQDIEQESDYDQETDIRNLKSSTETIIENISISQQFSFDILNNIRRRNDNNQLNNKILFSENRDDWSCKRCNSKFTSKISYKEHAKTCVINTKFNRKGKRRKKMSSDDLKCDVCLRKWPNLSSLLRHKNCHLKSNERPFKCDECCKGFNTKKHLENHKKIHKQPRILECDFCFKKFTSISLKNDHQKIHSNEYKKLVDKMGKKMAIIEYIKTNKSENNDLDMNSDVPSGYWRCDVCDKMFKNSYKPEEHQRLHNEIKPFICELCGKGLATQQLLNHHLLVHKEDRRFKCSKCGTGFFTAAHLKRHEQTTCNSEDLFECQTCLHRFSRKEHLVAHLLTHEKNRTKDFKCELCNACYLTANSLRVHKKKHIISIEGPFPCSQCSSLFTNKEAVKRHEKRHENKCAFKCEYCDKRFNDKDDMKQHIKRQHSSEIKTESTSS